MAVEFMRFWEAPRTEEGANWQGDSLEDLAALNSWLENRSPECYAQFSSQFDDGSVEVYKDGGTYVGILGPGQIVFVGNGAVRIVNPGGYLVYPDALEPPFRTP